MKKITLFMVAYCLLSLSFNAQKIYTSQVWHSSTQPAGDINHSESVTDANRNVYVVSNVLMSNNTTDVILTKYNRKGGLLWQQTFNGAGNGNDYGVTLKLNSSNDVYVAAALTGATSVDFGLIKYSSTGSLLWSSTWNSTNDGIDIPADIDVDANGNIYLVGGSQSSNLFSDYMVVKFNSSGAELWNLNYDYANLHDAATSVSVVNTSTIIVTGASASSVSNWDYATLKINTSNGTLNGSYRTNVPGVGLDNALAITTDDDSNIYITGYTEANGEKDIQTIKLDDELGLEWVVTYDNAGSFDDVGNSIVVDDNGNVYVTGYSENATGNDFFTIKYNAQGNQLWKEAYGILQGYDNAEAVKIAIADNGVIVVGTVVKDGINSFMIINYNENGILLFAEKFNSEDENETVEALSVDGEDVFVSGTSINNGVPKPITVKYTVVRKDISYVLNDDGYPLYETSDLIVRLNPAVIKLDAIYKKDFLVGKLEDFLEEDAVNEIRAAVTGVCNSDKCDITVYKIFMGLTPDLTSTTSRLGETIAIPNFWAALIFEFPEGVDVNLASVELNDLSSTIRYAELNCAIIGFDSANDEKYNDGFQASIHPTDDYPDAHINVEPAWDYETGKPFVKVGVLDSGIWWEHEDFASSNSPGSKVLGGQDYSTGPVGVPLLTSQMPDGNGHGTLAAGIIGARRDNLIGVAGIAGGNQSEFQGDTPPMSGTTGVSLYGLKILDDDNTLLYNQSTNSQIEAPINYVLNAIVGSAIDDESLELGYGLHLMNNSYGTVSGISAPFDSEENTRLLRDATEFANRAQVTFVAARGNGYANPNNYDNFIAPGTIDDDWILTVSGTDDEGNGMANGSMYGIMVDVGAPSGPAVTYSTTASSTNNSYSDFGDTSGAAAHVSGVASLLMSYLNDEESIYSNLAPEDVEFIVQMTADDINFSEEEEEGEFNGVDEEIGHGRVNAGNALAQVDKDVYELEHQTAYTDIIMQLIASNVTITLSEDYNKYYYDFLPEPEDEEWYYSDETYQVNIYEITKSYDLNASPHENDAIIAFWARHSASSSFPLIDENNVLLPRIKVEMIENTESTGLLRGYFYEILDNNQETISWWPAFPEGNLFVNFQYSVLYEKDVPFDNSIEEFENEAFVNISPNPSSDNQILTFKTKNDSDVKIELYDMEGKRVLDIYDGKLSSGSNTINVSLSSLADGMYFYHITLDKESKQIKIIKQ